MTVYVYNREDGGKEAIIKNVYQITERIVYRGVREYVIVDDKHTAHVFKVEDVKIRVFTD